MNNIKLSDHELIVSDGVIIYKNKNTTLGFVRFDMEGKVEYIFVNPSFRRQGLAKKLLELIKQKTGKKLIPQKPVSPLGRKLFNIN